MSALERIVSWFRGAPPARAALPPPRARRRGRRGYDGADHGRRLRRWRAGKDGPTARNGDLVTLRDRARDLRRNNPYAAKAIAAIVANTVGTGIEARLANAEAQRLWRAWASSRECDAGGRHDFAALQALVLGAVVESGEVFVRRRRRSAEEGLPAPLQLQVLEADYLDTSKTGLRDAGGSRTDFGIEYDDRNRPTAYWLFLEHPSDQRMTTTSTGASVRVPAEDVIHVMRVERPGQARGVPWLAPVMARLRMLDDYEDAALERARVAACFAAFVHDPLGESDPSAGVAQDGIDGGGNGLIGEQDEDLLDLYEQNYERIEPGIIWHLPDGKDVKFAQPPTVSDYAPFTEGNLRAIAAGLGVTYEVFTGDLSKTSFASARIGWLEFNRLIESWRWTMFIPQFLDRVWEWWAESMAIAVDLETTRPTWTPPRREMLSPTEETRAARERIRAGLTSQPEELRAYGFDPDQVLAEIAEWNGKVDALGIVLDTDPRKIGGPSGNVALADVMQDAVTAAQEKP